jgi:hypothetical protein
MIATNVSAAYRRPPEPADSDRRRYPSLNRSILARSSQGNRSPERLIALSPGLLRSTRSDTVPHRNLLCEVLRRQIESAQYAVANVVRASASTAAFGILDRPVKCLVRRHG